jgi:hypothetical protein
MADTAGYRIFPVCERVYCVWGWDLKEQNIQFIEGLDEDFFEYVANIHFNEIDDSDEQHASIALRANYYLCLETFFTLVSAVLQSPDMTPAWILKSRSEDVLTITRLLYEGRFSLPSAWKRDDGLSLGFMDISNLTFMFTDWISIPDDKTVHDFTALWLRLCDDFLNETNRSEYNSIKHGFRVRAGGFSISAGIEKTTGVPAAPEDMRFVGGSKFGSSSFSARQIEGSRIGERKDRHFTLLRKSINWDPLSIARRTILAAMSIRNLKSFLLSHNGTEPKSVQFHRLLDREKYLEPWSTTVGVTESSFSTVSEEDNIIRFSEDEMRRRIQHSDNG